jgi:hypothetical protein
MRWALLVLVAGCFQSIAPDVPDASPFEPTTGKFATERNADGSFTTIVDSSSETVPTLADLETGTAVTDTDPWDLGFQRFKITPATGVEIALVEAGFADVGVAPDAGWTSKILDDWYDYDSETHVLTPKPVTYAVRNSGSKFKFEITRYYDDAGNAGFFTIHWRSL